MADTLQNLLLGFQVVLTPSVLIYAFLGCLIGTIVGVLPGLGPLAGMSMLLPISFGLGRPESGKTVSLEILWPSGQKTSLTGVQPNQSITVQEQKGIVSAQPIKFSGSR